ncbi:MAG: hypothetical protein WCQ53_04110 [bacterium]
MKKILMVLSAGLIILSTTSCGGSDGTLQVFGAPTLSATVANANVSQASQYFGSPTYLQMTMYSIWVGVSPDCTDLKLVSDYGANGQLFNIFDKPTLFQGSPADGKYECMVIKMLDTMNFKPEMNAGTACAAGTAYPFDIAKGQDGVWVDKDFVPITTDNAANIVYLFATTDGTKTAAKGVNSGQTIPLTSALLVPGKITLVMDFTNRVYIETGNVCWLDSPTMAFQ